MKTIFRLLILQFFFASSILGQDTSKVDLRQYTNFFALQGEVYGEWLTVTQMDQVIAYDGVRVRSDGVDLSLRFPAIPLDSLQRLWSSLQHLYSADHLLQLEVELFKQAARLFELEPHQLLLEIKRPNGTETIWVTHENGLIEVVLDEVSPKSGIPQKITNLNFAFSPDLEVTNATNSTHNISEVYHLTKTFLIESYGKEQQCGKEIKTQFEDGLIDGIKTLEVKVTGLCHKIFEKRATPKLAICPILEKFDRLLNDTWKCDRTRQELFFTFLYLKEGNTLMLYLKGQHRMGNLTRSGLIRPMGTEFDSLLQEYSESIMENLIQWLKG